MQLFNSFVGSSYLFGFPCLATLASFALLPVTASDNLPPSRKTMRRNSNRFVSRKMWEALLVTIVLSLTATVGTSPVALLFAVAFVPPPSLDSYRRLDRHHQLDGSSPLPFGHSIILSAKQGRPKGSGRSEEEWDAVRAERKEQLREALCFDKKQIDKLVRAYPAVLTCHRIIEETFVPKVAMLQERLEIDQKTAGKILSNPFVFSISATSMLQKIDILHDRFRFNTKEIEKMCRNCPTIFSISIAALDERTRYVQTRLDLTDKELAEFIQMS